MFLSSSDLKVQVEDVLGRYFEKMYNLLSNGENLDEIANVLTIGQAYTRLPTSFDWDEIVYKCMETSVYKGDKQDKIEMRGDRAEMSDFPLYLNTVAGGLDRRDQTQFGDCL